MVQRWQCSCVEGIERIEQTSPSVLVVRGPGSVSPRITHSGRCPFPTEEQRPW